MDSVLQTALAEAIDSLASFFGTTTETIMNHAPEFLAKYGWYSTLNSLGVDIVVAIFAALIVCVIGGLLCLSVDIELKHPILVSFCIVVTIVVVLVGQKIVTCAIAPEIVGAHAIMELLNSAK